MLAFIVLSNIQFNIVALSAIRLYKNSGIQHIGKRQRLIKFGGTSPLCHNGWTTLNVGKIRYWRQQGILHYLNRSHIYK